MNRTWLGNLLIRLLLFAVLWWGLTEGRLPDLLAAPVFIVIAAVLSMYCIRPGTLSFRLRAVPGFFAFFFWETFLAGFDVSRRAFDPKLPLKPGMISYTLQLPGHSSRIFFVWMVSLLPGTAGISLKKQQVLIHVLDIDQAHQEKLRIIEDRIARLFGSDE